MRFKHLRLENWRNFLRVDVPIESRVFLIGPNASGKSNLLDVFRFLRDVADPQGGFQQAVGVKRKGVSQLRSLHARRYSTIVIEVEVDLEDGVEWLYRLVFNQDNLGRPIVRKELVRANGQLLLERPDSADKDDESLLTQTHLEQVSANKRFRAMQEFLARVSYLHIVPQIVREPERSIGRAPRDPFGGDFLEQIARTPKNVQSSRLDKIGRALQVAVPQLREVKLEPDERGVPHLRGLYEHWRANAGWQTEDQFSDGTLRLLGLLWALLDGQYPLLLEEPELSLHAEIVRHIPSMMARISRAAGRQLLVSTHSTELLSDPGISAEEVLLLRPTAEDTAVFAASSDEQVRSLVEGGTPLAEAVVPRTAPRVGDQLSLFGD